MAKASNRKTRTSAYINAVATETLERNNGEIVGTTEHNYSLTATDTVLSEGHRWPPKKQRFKEDLGGNFFAESYSATTGFPNVDVRTSLDWVYQYHLRGLIMPASGVDFPAAIAPSSNNMNVYGTAGFNRTLPTKPQADVAQLIGEANKLPREFDLLKMQSTAKEFVKRFPKRAGGDYLNVEFGWKPFIKDIQQALKSFVDFGEGAKKFEAGSGKVLRRRHQFPVVHVERGGYPLSGYGWPVAVTDLYKKPGSGEVKLFQTEKAWFVASYTYYVQGSDIGHGIPRALQLLNHMYGIDLTPALLWELAPWSWMLDYYGNVGQVLQNLAAFSRDNLVAHYAYVMCEITVEAQATLSGLQFINGSVVASSMTLKSKTKTRRGGGPYGTGFTGGTLTPKQNSILAALAFSRL